MLVRASFSSYFVWYRSIVHHEPMRKKIEFQIRTIFILESLARQENFALVPFQSHFASKAPISRPASLRSVRLPLLPAISLYSTSRRISEDLSHARFSWIGIASIICLLRFFPLRNRFNPSFTCFHPLFRKPSRWATSILAAQMRRVLRSKSLMLKL